MPKWVIQVQCSSFFSFPNPELYWCQRSPSMKTNVFPPFVMVAPLLRFLPIYVGRFEAKPAPLLMASYSS